jgi:hypothetical protein
MTVINSFSELSEHELEKAKDVLLHPRDVLASLESSKEACGTLLKNGLLKLGLKHIRLAARNQIFNTHSTTVDFVALYRDVKLRRRCRVVAYLGSLLSNRYFIDITVNQSPK